MNTYRVTVEYNNGTKRSYNEQAVCAFNVMHSAKQKNSDYKDINVTRIYN